MTDPDDYTELEMATKSICPKCDGTGSQCNACDAGIMDCNCGPDAEPSTCEKCTGIGSIRELAKKTPLQTAIEKARGGPAPPPPKRGYA